MQNTQYLAWFLGPQGENAALFERLFMLVFRGFVNWRRSHFPDDEAIISEMVQKQFVEQRDIFQQKVLELMEEFKKNFPFYSPRYVAEMVSDTTLPAMLGYIAGILYNSNNVSPDVGSVTLNCEIEAVGAILKMLGYNPPPSPPSPGDENVLEYYARAAQCGFGWAHITPGGTLSNIEALWVARTVRYFPLSVREVALREDLSIPIKRPDGEWADLRNCTEREVLLIQPDESIRLLARYIAVVKMKYGIPADGIDAAERQAWNLLRTSEYSLSQGFGRLFYKFPPVIFASGAAHSSIRKKAADLLGIGRDNVVLVEMDSEFRMRVDDLEEKSRAAVEQGKIPTAVVALAGSTYSGSVDPIHEIVSLRERLESENNISFWLHVDAAWGGYIRSLFTPEKEEPADGKIQNLMKDFVQDDIDLEWGNYNHPLKIKWGAPGVVAALMAFPTADSITVDPHKMGYVPYACGVITFKNDRVRHFLRQKGDYRISSAEGELFHLPPKHATCGSDFSTGNEVVIGPFGSYTLEGSRAGAAAASLWLATETVPLTMKHHGSLVRASLLAAREIYEWLAHWEAIMAQNGITVNYRFVPLTQAPPHTNIVTFTVAPHKISSLQAMNCLTQLVYEQFTTQRKPGEDASEYCQPLFLSRVVMEEPEYRYEALNGFFESCQLGTGVREVYQSNGLVVLRATVMSPYLYASKMVTRQNLIKDFIEQISEASRCSLSKCNF